MNKKLLQIMNENRNTFLGCFHDHLRNGNGFAWILWKSEKMVNLNDDCGSGGGDGGVGGGGVNGNKNNGKQQ